MYLGQRIRQDEKIKIGKNIRRIRKEKKIGQKEMAEKMQLRQIPISRDTYIKLERGDRNIGASELKVIKEILETTYEVLFEETEEQDESEYKQQFIDDIAACPKWTLVDFYIDKGMTAPHMENSKEWCRLLDDCLSGKVDLIVTQKVRNVSSDWEEITFLSRILAAQKKPVGIYFVSEDIYTLASYYLQDLHQGSLLPEDWKVLPEDDLDRELLKSGVGGILLEDTNDMQEDHPFISVEKS